MLRLIVAFIFLLFSSHLMSAETASIAEITQAQNESQPDNEALKNLYRSPDFLKQTYTYQFLQIFYFSGVAVAVAWSFYEGNFWEIVSIFMALEFGSLLKSIYAYIEKYYAPSWTSRLASKTPQWSSIDEILGALYFFETQASTQALGYVASKGLINGPWRTYEWISQFLLSSGTSTHNYDYCIPRSDNSIPWLFKTCDTDTTNKSIALSFILDLEKNTSAQQDQRMGNFVNTVLSWMTKHPDAPVYITVNSEESCPYLVDNLFSLLRQKTTEQGMGTSQISFVDVKRDIPELAKYYPYQDGNLVIKRDLLNYLLPFKVFAEKANIEKVFNIDHHVPSLSKAELLHYKVEQHLDEDGIIWGQCENTGDIWDDLDEEDYTYDILKGFIGIARTVNQTLIQDTILNQVRDAFSRGSVHHKFKGFTHSFTKLWSIKHYMPWDPTMSDLAEKFFSRYAKADNAEGAFNWFRYKFRDITPNVPRFTWFDCKDVPHSSRVK